MVETIFLTLIALFLVGLGIYLIITSGFKCLKSLIMYGSILDGAHKWGFYAGICLEFISLVICLYLRFSGRA